MRLIDVNKLKENLTTEIYSYSKGDIRKRLFARGLSLAYDIVNRQPTVEQKHGHWIEANDISSSPFDAMKRCLCSECREWGVVTNYCPNCGAKMDEVEENG